MLETIEGYYVHVFLMLLFIVGLYAMMMKKNFVKKILGMTMIQSAAILFWILIAFKEGATVPVLDPGISLQNPDMYMNPMPHTLMLTAIVVAVVTKGVAIGLAIAIYRNYKTLNEHELLERTEEEE